MDRAGAQYGRLHSVNTIPFALQLYTVRDRLAADLPGTLAQISRIGYRHVEMAGTQGRSPKEYKSLLCEFGLTAISAHVPIEKIIGKPEAAADYARACELEYLVIPWAGGEAFSTKQAWLELARRIDTAGATLRRAGIRLCYHNHAHEFQPVEGAMAHDILFENTDPEHLAVQLDSCWAAVAGMDVLALLRKYTGRVPLLHVKDYKPGAPPTLTEVGNGCMPWQAILPAAAKAGVAWYILEQDDHFAPGLDGHPDALESARISAAFMQELEQR